MQGILRPVALTLSLIASTGAALAQTTALKFQLDWRFEGPAALFLVAAAKGYFKDAKLDVTNHVGHSRGGAFLSEIDLPSPGDRGRAPALVLRFGWAYSGRG